jgi:predicted AlkP superfamily phosphohydrolase/phosphomutase
MKLLVIGLDCAAPEILHGMDDLPNIRRLMDAGMFGPLESVIPPITVPAWMCMSTSRDPGSLGVYGFRNRADHSYAEMQLVDSRSIRDVAVWDQVAREGKRSVVIGVPPGYPPRKVNGVFVSGFLTPDSETCQFTHPPEAKKQIEQLVGEYPVDVKGFRTDDKDWLKEQIFAMSRKQFQVVRHFMANEDWDYFQFVEIGLDRIHHGFWKHHDETHRFHEPGNRYRNVVRDYYRHLDEQIGGLLELLDEDAAVLILSDHGARKLDGGFCVNEWLMREGMLTLKSQPDRSPGAQPTALKDCEVDWSKTQGGTFCYAANRNLDRFDVSRCRARPGWIKNTRFP